MAPPPSLKRLQGEQYEEAPGWFLEKFLPAFNGFAGDVVNALTGALTSGENIRAEEREIKVIMPSGSGSPDSAPYPILITPQRVTRPKNVVVTCVRMETVTGSPSSGVWPFWELTSDGRVKIRWFSGLDADTTYTVRVRFD